MNRIEEARLHIETEIVKRHGIEPHDRLDTVTNMLLILVDKYRRMGTLLGFAVALLILETLGLGYALYVSIEIQSRMLEIQGDQETLISQQRETRRAITETKDKLDKTSLTITETKEAVDKVAEDVAPPPPKKKR